MLVRQNPAHRGASPETILTAERVWRRPRLVTADTRRPGPRPGRKRPAAWSLRTASGGNAGDGSGPWADSATVERREAASRLRGTAHASQAWRRALTSATSSRQCASRRSAAITPKPMNYQYNLCKVAAIPGFFPVRWPGHAGSSLFSHCGRQRLGLDRSRN